MAQPQTQVLASVEIVPDDPGFLPRFLTVQLLAILAKTIEYKPEEKTSSAEAKHFVAHYQNKALYTPLTYSIFWREHVAKTLQTEVTAINTPDQYARTPLTLALANEDFVLAQQLLQQGAILFMEDKLILEIALTSIIQRDKSIIERIVTNTEEHNKQWVTEYLRCLEGHILGTHTPDPKKYHEVINPPIRQFGQVLDTLTYFNGLPSHYGFLSPSIDLLTAHLQQYTAEIADVTTKNLFTIISNAYKYTKDTCKYFGNLPTNANAAATLAAQIATNINTKTQSVVVIFGGFAGNAVAIAFIGKTFILSNLGIGGNPESGTQIFNITQPQAITNQVIHEFIHGLGNAADPTEILGLLSMAVDPKPIFTLKQVLNPIDNCIFVNPRAIIQGILLVLSGLNQSQVGTAERIYQDYINSLHKFSSGDLVKFMRNRQLLKDKRIECCAIALEYINQHYKEPESLARCIDLKNALEFVGLKDYYINNVTQEAKTAIQNMMIHQQEATAVQVIEKEYALAAANAQKKK